jgi:transposase
MYSLIETAYLNGLAPQLYLTAGIADHPARQIAELLPWPWHPADLSRSAA